MTKPIIKTGINRKFANRDLVSIKLTDTQRIVLSCAAQRSDGAAMLLERMTEKATIMPDAGRPSAWLPARPAPDAKFVLHLNRRAIEL